MSARRLVVRFESILLSISSKRRLAAASRETLATALQGKVADHYRFLLSYRPLLSQHLRMIGVTGR
jgi:hypothetical protein